MMGLVLFSIVLFLVSLFMMWFSIFGKKKEVNGFASGVPTDIGDFLIMIIYKIFPHFLRRVFLFLLGLGIVFGIIYLWISEFA